MNDKTEAQTEENSELATLRKQNAELHKDIKARNAAISRLESERDTAKEEAENANLDELTQARNQITKLTKDLADANTKASEATKSFHSYKADNEISNLLIAHKVQPDDAPMVTAYLKSLRTLDDDGASSFDGKTGEEFAKAYFAGAGKRYTSAPDNSGGGSTGFDGTKPPRMTAENWNWTEFGKIQLENPAEAREIAEKAGKNIG
jgi:cell division protein FtsB